LDISDFSPAHGGFQADAPLGRSLLCLDAAALLLGVGQEAAARHWMGNDLFLWDETDETTRNGDFNNNNGE